MRVQSSHERALGYELERDFAIKVERLEMLVPAESRAMSCGARGTYKQTVRRTYPPMYDAITLSIWPLYSSLPVV